MDEVNEMCVCCCVLYCSTVASDVRGHRPRTDKRFGGTSFRFPLVPKYVRGDLGKAHAVSSAALLLRVRETLVVAKDDISLDILYYCTPFPSRNTKRNLLQNVGWMTGLLWIDTVDQTA